MFYSRHARDESSKVPRRLIGDAAKLRFLKGLRAGQKREDAAAGTGFAWRSFYQVRRRDPIFKFAWVAALEISAMEERDRRRSEESLDRLAADGLIERGNKRMFQRKVRRGLSFDERRQQIFLDHFAGTADEHGAAAAAGVSYVTVRALIRRDPGFAALRDEALELAYAVLEAEAVRQRLEAQRRLRDNLDPKGEMAREFERVMRLLDRHRRPDGRIATREHAPSAKRAFSFEDGIAALDKALDALGARRGPAPPPQSESGSGGRATDG